MGYKLDGISFLGEWWDDHDGNGGWLSDDTITGCVFEPLRAGGWLERATQLSIDGGDPIAIASMARLEQRARKWRRGTAAMFTGDQYDPDWLFHVALEPAGMRIALGFGAALVTDDLRDRVAGWVHGWSERLGQRGLSCSARSSPSSSARPSSASASSRSIRRSCAAAAV